MNKNNIYSYTLRAAQECTVVLKILVGVAVSMVIVNPTAAEFVAEEFEVCPVSAGVIDPEFDSNSQSVVFFDTQKRLKVAGIRPDGTVKSKGCRGAIIDTDVTLDVPGFPLKNGAEWAWSQRGREIYYTKLIAEGQPTLARAWFDGASWHTELLTSGTQRGLPLASIDLSDADTRLLYVRSISDTNYEHLWREAEDPGTELSLPAIVTQSSGSSPRWVPGQRAISTTQADVDGVYQAALYFIDTQETQVLTSDAGRKEEVWMWQAPEFGNEYVFMTVVDGRYLRVYRRIGDSWAIIRNLDAKSFSSRSLIFSPEPFVHNGRSYVVMQLSGRKYGPGEIWIASIDSSDSLLIPISDLAQPNLVRTEPEWLATSEGVFVYYTLVYGPNKISLRRLKTPL